MPTVAGGKYFREKKLDGTIVLSAMHSPRHVLVEITTECNLSCRMCVRHAWKEPGGTMPLSAFRQIADLRQVYPSLEHLHLLGFGEPMFHPQFWEILAQASEAGYRCHLVTNGSLLGASAIRRLAGLRLASVYVSVDHVDPVTVDAGWTGRDYLPALERAARLAVACRSRGGDSPTVGLAIVAQKSNIAQLPRLIEQAFRAGIREYRITNLLAHDQASADETLYGAGERRLDTGVYSPFASIQTPEMVLRTERTCRFAKHDAFVIGWDGEVYPCLAFSHTYPSWIMGRPKRWLRHSFGNLFRQDFSAIWRSEAFSAFRARLARFDLPSCTDCASRDGCGYAQDTAMDCWGLSPSCGDCLWSRGIISCPGLD